MWLARWGDAWGSPQGQFDIPYGLVAASPSFALVAQRYMSQYGVAPEALAKIAVDERNSALKNPKAVFRDKPITIDGLIATEIVTVTIRKSCAIQVKADKIRR